MRHFDVAELLCQHGAAVDVRGYNNRTLLHAASEDGFIDVVQWLLDHGADADLQDDDRGIQF
jgi:ankyrin repeat protein